MSVHDDPPTTGELISITEVERQTGIRQSTLRMWEKRYGFPQPLRDRHGDRVYPPGQVERLHAVRRLIDQGLRPGKILSGEPAYEAGRDEQATTGGVIPAHYRYVFDPLRDYQLAELHGLFEHRLLDLGLRRFVIEFLAPLSAEIGLARSRGALPVRHEQLFAQLAAATLHAKQAAVRAAGDGRPKVVLASLSGEGQALGILMVEAVMTSLGMNCIQLGASTPPLEVAAAAGDTGADIVALSFGAYFPRKSTVRMTTSLRTALPSATALWIAGEGVRGMGALAAGIDILHDLDAIEPALRRWQATHVPGEAPRWRAP